MFRRKRTEPDDTVEADDDTAGDAAATRANGPWDASEVTVSDDEDRVDLGSMLLTPHKGVEVQLQVEEATQQVMAVMLAGADGAAELRAFAAPRHGDIWADVRRILTAEVAQLGGTATEAEGPFGTELLVSLTVDLPDGQRGVQASKVIGISGPRWLLRATLFGRPAVTYLEDGDIERALRDVVVVRGGTPIPPGDALPLTMPANARPAGPPPE